MPPFIDFAEVISADLNHPDEIRVRGFWRDHDGEVHRFPDAGDDLEDDLPVTVVWSGTEAAGEFGSGAGTALDQAIAAAEVCDQILTANASQVRDKHAMKAFGGWLLDNVLLAHPAARQAFEDADLERGQAAPPGQEPVLRMLLQFGDPKEFADLQSAAGMWGSLPFELAFDKTRQVFLHGQWGRSIQILRTPDVQAFVDRENSERCLAPRFFCGIASPWEKSRDERLFLPGLDYLALLRGGVSDDQIDTFLTLSTLREPARRTRSDVVILVAHGERKHGQVHLKVLEDANPLHRGARYHADASPDDIVTFLKAVGARLAVLVCCQPLDLLPNYNWDLGATLLRDAPSLAAVVSFRTKLTMDAAHGFLHRLIGALRENPFHLSHGLIHARRGMPTQEAITNLSRFDFAIPTLHAQRELVLQTPLFPDFVTAENIPTVEFPPELVRHLIAAWGVSEHGTREVGRLAKTDARAIAHVLADAKSPKPLRFQPYMQNLGPIAIGRYPVTWLDFAPYYRTIGKFPPADRDWFPVTGISLNDTLGYAVWLGQQDGMTYRFPRIDEWIRIAYWGNARLFPWGNDWDPDRARAELPASALEEGLIPVYEGRPNSETQPERQVFGMIGNCWELIPVTVNGRHVPRIIGGGFRSPRWECSAVAYQILDVNSLDEPLPDDIGFRLVRN